MSQQIPSFVGPASQGVLLKQRGMNANLTGSRPMPMKFSPSAGDSMFSNARSMYQKNAGGGKTWNDSSAYTQLKRVNAIGQSSKKIGIPLDQELSFRSQDRTSRNSHLSRVRGGGCVAPPKKGANTSFKSGGGSRITGTGNRQIFAP